MFVRKFTRFLGITAALGVVVLAAGVPGAAQPAELALLSTLERGEWTIRFRDKAPARKICLRTGRELIKLRHGSNNCSLFVVEDNKQKVTVQYTCKGKGYARTSIRAETTGLVQIESNGIAGGLPFQFNAEGRKTGICN